jgi:phosphoribosylamine--glycine ligase
MSRVLLIDQGGFMADFAMRCQDAGHEVRWFIRRVERTKDIGRGLLIGKSKLVDDWQSWMRWSDIVVLGDNTKYLREIDAWRKNEGIKVVGACAESTSWELDRNCGQALMKKRGLKIAPYREFKDYDQAIAYVKREGRAFVSKPCGDEPDKSLTYVSKSPADLVYMLERWKKAKRHKGSFILQECVTGTEMAVGGWFGPAGFIEGWHENFEFKKLMAGDTGPATGEMGTVIQIVKKSKLADKVLKPFEDELHRIGYVGYIDVNCIIDEKGVPYPLEFTTRPGWPTFNIQTAMLKGDPLEWLIDLAEGRSSTPFGLQTVAVGVVMAIPDFPFSLFTRKDVTGIPIYGIDSRSQNHIHPCEVMRGEAPHNVNGKVVTLPCLVSAGDYLLVASGLGSSVRAARAAAYRTLEKLEVPNSPFWRPDIGDRLRKQLPTIQALGYATTLSF